jgi:hypothetical protein
MALDELDDRDAPRPQGSFLTLPVLFLMAWLIFEVTHNPALAAMAMCLKFGWEDFRTALWLKRTDPERGRGAACCWLYVASGLWQTAIIGVAMALLTVVIAELIQIKQQGQGNLLQLFMGAVFAILFGFVFSTVSTYIALGYAHRHGVRPWLNGAVHIARRHGHWPPLYGQHNRVMILVLTTVIITFVILVPVLLILGAIVLRPIIPVPFLAGLGFVVPLFFYVVLLPASLIIVINLRRQGFFAQHPADCWGEEGLPAKNSEVENEQLNV